MLTVCIHILQVLEALALAEPPPEVQDNLKPDHEWMLCAAKEELLSFRVTIYQNLQSSRDEDQAPPKCMQLLLL